MGRGRFRRRVKLGYATDISNCASFVFVGEFNDIRRRNALGGTLEQVVESYGCTILSGKCARSAIALPRFDGRSLERAFTAEVYRTSIGLGIVRSVLNRTSVGAAVSVCTRTAGSLGRSRVINFRRFFDGVEGVRSSGG